MSILDTIDHAIADWETSPDAMRWAPDAPKLPTVSPIRIEPSRVDTVAFTAAMQAFARAAEAVGGAFAEAARLFLGSTRPAPSRRRTPRKGAARWRKTRT